MLILSRKVGQRIQIGEHITLMVTAIGDGRCKIGVEAPANMPVIRRELRERVLGALDEGRLQSLSDEMDEEENR